MSRKPEYEIAARQRKIGVLMARYRWREEARVRMMGEQVELAALVIELEAEIRALGGRVLRKPFPPPRP